MPVLEHTGARALTVDASELVTVLGAPGSGKTRLALELAYLARPGEGEVLFHGRDPMTGRGRRRASRRPRAITMLVQNAEDQLFARTVFDDVAFGPRRLLVAQGPGYDPGEIERRVLVALTAVHLDPTAVVDRSPFALSGGERRRVALAGVLAMEPEVLILDEPTSNLDPGTREAFVDLLEPLRGRSAIVWFTTRAAEAARGDRVYLLRDDRTQEVAAGADLLADWRPLTRAGIELPPVYELAGALERRCMRLPDRADPHEMQGAIVQRWREAHGAG